MNELNLYFNEKKELETKIIYQTKFVIENKFLHFYFFDEDLIKDLSTIKKEQLEILEMRVYGLTLQEIADIKGLTRERVRQIESDIVKKILLFHSIQKLLNFINNYINKKSIFFLDELPLNDNYLKKLFVYVINKPKIKLLFFDKVFQSFILNDKFGFENLKNKLNKYIDSENYLIDSNQFEELYPIKTEKIYTIFIENKIIKGIDNKIFIMFSLKSQREKLEFIMTLFPDGIEHKKNADLIRDKCIYFFGDECKKINDRNLISPLDHSEKIYLKDWGKYIHIKYIQSILENSLDFVIEYLEDELEDIQINLDECFNKFKNKLENIGIDNKYFLHTILKLKYPEEFNYNDSPWIVPKGVQKVELTKTLEKIVKENKVYYFNDIKNKLKIPNLRLKALLSKNKNIIRISEYGYLNKKYLIFDDREIQSWIEDKLKKLDFFYVELLLDKFINQLNEKFVYLDDFEAKFFVLDYFYKYNKDYIVTETRFMNTNLLNGYNDFNFHKLIEKYLLNTKQEISMPEVISFYQQRGLKENIIKNRLFHTVEKFVCRIDEKNIVSLKSLKIDKEIIYKINELVKDIQQEISLEDFIQQHNLNYSKYTITDILNSRYITILPSRENPIWIEKK